MLLKKRPHSYCMAFLRSTDGATAIEYGLIVALIAVALIGVLTQIGTGINANFECSSGIIGGQSPEQACK